MNAPRTKRTSITLLVLALLGLGGCVRSAVPPDYALADSGHRLVRISFRGQTVSFRMRINGGPVCKFANGSFTNTMMGFRFQYGDIVVWEAVRDLKGQELSNPEGLSAWWFGYLEQVRASFYSINSDNIQDFFATPLYHWAAPFQKPRPLSSASFYCDGTVIGTGSAGLRALVDSFHQLERKGATVFLLAPRFRNEGDPNWLAGEQWSAWLQESGAGPQRWPAEILDFARMMDEQ
jgi:hypothetical protein